MIKIFKFRKNDLNPSLGKQIEFNQNVVSSFFQFSEDEVKITATYKSLDGSGTLNNKQYQSNLKLSPSRGDYKIYTNPDQSKNIKDLFIEDLKLNEEDNINDYFALEKNDNTNYDLYYIPAATSISVFLDAIKNKAFDFSLETEINVADYRNEIIEDSKLRNIIYKTFKYIVSHYGEECILQSSSRRTTSINKVDFTSIILPDYFNNENILLTSSTSLSKDDLSSSGTLRYFESNLDLKISPNTYFTTQWYDQDDKDASLANFNRFLANISADTLEVINENNIFKLVNKKGITQSINNNEIGENKIYFGAPGTGKSHAIKEELKRNFVDSAHYKRITFHPDMDYSSFIGGYKPYTDATDGDKIKYKFVPQVFIDLYIKAWSNPKKAFYLVIEEINRGNCAEIFGDIFQLLDRNPEYNIEPTTELREHLETIEKDKGIELLFDGKLQMPERLSILASMNTSDQSLYPMDSAFKRRWDWKYVAIDTKCKNSDFIIEILDDHKYSWLKFLEAVNKKIYEVTKSEDKQVGNWFVNATNNNKIIDKETFINKVIFYLWNDVFKDEVFHSDNIFVLLDSENKKVENISFNDFFNIDRQDKLLINLIESVLKVSNDIKEQKRDDLLENESIIDTENEE